MPSYYLKLTLSPAMWAGIVIIELAEAALAVYGLVRLCS